MRLLALAVAVLGLAGCGTMANLQGKRYALISKSGERPVRVYGGLRNDIEWVADAIGLPESRRTPQDDSAGRQPASLLEDPFGLIMGAPLFGYFALIDPVLSFVGDTVTLPVALLGTSTDDDSNIADVATTERSPRPGPAR